ncbi:MAG: hypothetical protein HYS56_01325, partial [Candidatus Omnitrophica bacterium]|nr:hypothetical protein [Candidatus Omnitrophota bacterium]
DDIPVEIPEDGWGLSLDFSINAKGEAASSREGLRIHSGEQVWEYHDSEEQMMLSILTAQRFAWIAGWMSGTQDDVAGGRTGNPAVGDAGGLRLLTAGEPMRGEINGRQVSFKGGIIPTVTSVSLSADARQKLEHGIRILRIGMTDTAEDTLNQVYVNQMINKVVPQSDAWAQITLEMVKALIRGDTVQAGRLARAAVPLRESLAVVSINPIVIDALETMITDYGSEGFSYGITGARSTGSVLLFFPPQMSEERIQQLMQEAKERIEQAIHSRGKLGPVEDEPQPYRSRLTARGARVRLLDPVASERRQKRIIEPLGKKLGAVHRGMQKKHILYSPDEAEAILARVPVIKAEGSPILEAKDALTINPVVRPYLDEKILSDLTQGRGGERESLETATQNVFTTVYQRFNAPGANPEVRKLIRDRLLANIRLIAQLGAEQQVLIYTASEENKLDLLLPYTEEDISRMGEILANGGEIDGIQKKYQGFRAIFEGQIIDRVNSYDGTKKDGTRFCGKEFYVRLNEEIRELKETIVRQEENGQGTTEEEFLLTALQLAPNPEVLPYNHFLFTMSRTYKAFFGEKIRALSEGMREGALVYGVPAGGMGTRFGGANVIKQVVNWHFAHEADASYLKLLLRKWARFLERFPEKREGFLHLIVSAFTEDAIRAVLDDFVQEAGLDPEQVAVNHQSLRQVVWPTPAELALELALQSAATPQQMEELTRKYERYTGRARGRLRMYNDVDSPDNEAGGRIRSPFSSGGLNPLNIYSPSGTVGSLEGTLVENSGSYTVARLKRMGYEVDEKRIELIPVEEQGAISLEQLEGGIGNAAACWDDLVRNGYIDSKGVVQPKSLEAQLAVDLKLTEKYEHATLDLLRTLLFDSQRMGMPLAKAALVVKGNGLSVLVFQNSSSRAPVGGGDLAVADAMDDFRSNPGRMAVVQYANVAGGIDAGGVLVKNSEGFVESLEGNLKQFAEGLFLDEDYTAQATGTTFLNLKQIWKLMSYGGVEEYLKTNLDERRRKMRTQMDQEWEPVYALKQRREELVGRSDDWMVLQTEHVLARILSGWVPRKFGKETVRFQETTARVSYRDDKNVGALLDSLTQDTSFRGTPLRTRLPVNLDQHYHWAQAVSGWIEWAQLYRQIGLIREAFVASQRARQALRELDKGEVSSRELSGGVREILSSLESELQRQIGETNTAHTQLTTEQITNDFLRAFNWTQNIGITELDPSEIQIELESLSRLVRTIDLLLLQQQETVSPNDEKSLRFIRAEVIALINQVIDLVGTSAAGLPVQEKGFRVFSHKIRCLIDKDATIEDPGTPLQQAPLTALGRPNEPITPDQARQLIQFAVRGAIIDILTGSTALEAWNHVFVPVLSVIQQMELPRIAQVIALRRIRILANDGSSVVSVDTANSQFKAKKLEHNQRYEGGQWVSLRSLLRYQGDRSEDKSNRLAVWDVAIHSFLKRFFSERRPQDLLGLDDNPQTREQQVRSLKEFIDQLKLPAKALPDMTAMSEEEFHNAHESLAWGLRQMLNNQPPGDWKNILNRILNPENGSSSLQNKLDGRDSSPLTADEELLAAFSLIHFKESDWTFGSISGDHLDKLYNNRKDHRLAPLAALLLNNTAFWSEVSSMSKTALTAARLVDQDHQEIPFTIRAGPGYFNVAFGGVSKINFLSGMLQDPLTLNNVVLVMGDSITDQGEFPTVARQKISSPELVEELKQQFPAQVVSSYLRAEVDSRQEVIRIRKKGTLSPNQLTEMKQWSDRPQWQEVVETLSRSEEAVYPLQGMNASIAASFRIKLEGRVGTVEFEGPMSLTDYAYLSRSVTLNHADTGWNRSVIGLHHNSMAMHQERLLLRFLLGTMVEMDAVERSKRMRAGLLRTQYSFSTLDPLKNGHTIRRWGPAAFYPIVDAVLQVAEQDPIYGRGLSPTEVTPIRDQMVRAVVETMNRSHVEGVRVILPETLKKTRPVSSERQSAENAPEHFL